jgi:hypothetical protein
MKVVLVHLEIVSISMQDWCTVCAERATGSEIILRAPDGTPMCVGLVEARFDPFGDSVNLNTRLVHGLRITCNRLRNHFGRTRWNS